MGTETALIFGAMPQPDWQFLNCLRQRSPYVICADGGIDCARQAGFMPAVYVGDGDSGGRPLANGENLLLPTHKDETDMEAAYLHAKKRNCTEVFITACSGGRQDHQLAVLQLLERAYDEGIRATLLDCCNSITCIGAGKHSLQTTGYRYFSLLPINKRLCGVTIRHAAYLLTEATVQRGSSLCISNEAIGDFAEVAIKEGKAWLVLSR